MSMKCFRFVAGAIVKIIFRSDDHQQNDIGGKLNEMEDDDDETPPRVANASTLGPIEDDDDETPPRVAHASTLGPIEDDDDDWPYEIKMTGNVLRQYGDDYLPSVWFS